MEKQLTSNVLERLLHQTTLHHLAPIICPIIGTNMPLYYCA